MEAVLLVADVLDGLASGVDNGVGAEIGAADFAGDDHPVRGRKRLTGDPNLIGVQSRRVALAEEQIDNFVRDSVADFVRMPLGNRLAREFVILTRH